METDYQMNFTVFQQDLAPCHASKAVKQFMNEQGILCLEWPGNSPDIGPIENIWDLGHLQKKFEE